MHIDFERKAPNKWMHEDIYYEGGALVTHAS